MNPMSGYDIRLVFTLQAYSPERGGEGNPHLFDIRPADDPSQNGFAACTYLYAVRPSPIGLPAKCLNL